MTKRGRRRDYNQPPTTNHDDDHRWPPLSRRGAGGATLHTKHCTRHAATYGDVWRRTMYITRDLSSLVHRDPETAGTRSDPKDFETSNCWTTQNAIDINSFTRGRTGSIRRPYVIKIIMIIIRRRRRSNRYVLVHGTRIPNALRYYSQSHRHTKLRVSTYNVFQIWVRKMWVWKTDWSVIWHLRGETQELW